VCTYQECSVITYARVSYDTLPDIWRRTYESLCSLTSTRFQYQKHGVSQKRNISTFTADLALFGDNHGLEGCASSLSRRPPERVDDTHLRGHGGTSGREQARGVGCSLTSPCGTQDQVRAELTMMAGSAKHSRVCGMEVRTVSYLVNSLLLLPRQPPVLVHRVDFKEIPA
jgi:hypothetical protein